MDVRYRELLHEPKDHEGIGPVGKHRRTNDRVLLSTLGVSRTEELLGFLVGDLDAPTGPISLNDIARSSLDICVEEHDVAVTSARITTQHYRNRLLACAMIPKGSELINHQIDFFFVAQGPDFIPLQVLVFKHGSRVRQSATSLTRPASSRSKRRLNKSEQCGIGSQPSCKMYAFGTSLKDRITTVAKVIDEPEACAPWSHE